MSYFELFCKKFVPFICFIISHTVYTPYNTESKLFSVYYTFAVFNSFSATHYCFALVFLLCDSRSGYGTLIQ